MISRNPQRQLSATRSRAAGCAIKRAEARARQAAQPHAQAYAAMQAFRGMRLSSPTRAAGLSLVELLIALAITALLMTAVMVATDASFKAYAAAAESASAQSATRMVTNRLLTLVRTSTVHEPLMLDGDPTWPVTLKDDFDDTLESKWIEMIDQQGSLVRLEYRDALDELWVLIDEEPPTDNSAPTWDTEQPLLGGVTAASFCTHVRTDNEGVLVLDRATMDISVAPDADNTLAIESDTREPIRVIASTMPRKLN